MSSLTLLVGDDELHITADDLAAVDPLTAELADTLLAVGATEAELIRRTDHGPTTVFDVFSVDLGGSRTISVRHTGATLLTSFR